MSFLSRFFSSKSVARDLQLTDKDLHTIWNDYKESVQAKANIILVPPQYKPNQTAQLLQLERHIHVELIDIFREEKDEDTILADLKQLENDERIKRVKRLEQTLFYDESQHRYLYEVLKHLHELLKVQLHLVQALQMGHNEKLFEELKENVKAEAVIVKEADIADFNELFAALAKGEVRIKQITEKEEQFIAPLRRRLEPIFGRQIDRGIIYEWGNTVLGVVKSKVYEHITTTALDHHPYMDLEFVNRPEFEELVRKTIVMLRSRSTKRSPDARPVSEAAITAFVEVFRDWYNHLPHDADY